MIDLQKIADEAEVIISGFALTKCEEGIRVFDLNNGKGAAVFTSEGTLIESNMDDIELSVAKKYYSMGMKYMEESNAEVLSI